MDEGQIPKAEGMEPGHSGCDNRPDDVAESPTLEFVKPEFVEMFDKIRKDMNVVFPYDSNDSKMIAAVGVLLASRIDVAVQLLKPPTKMVKLSPDGVIIPGG